MKRKKAAKVYRKIAARLDRLRSEAADHISRRDNNQVFEVAFWFREVADRIEAGYPESDYAALLASYRSGSRSIHGGS